jgi:hypothetical protein
MTDEPISPLRIEPKWIQYLLRGRSGPWSMTRGEAGMWREETFA